MESVGKRGRFYVSYSSPPPCPNRVARNFVAPAPTPSYAEVVRVHSATLQNSGLQYCQRSAIIIEESKQMSSAILLILCKYFQHWPILPGVNRVVISHLPYVSNQPALAISSAKPSQPLMRAFLPANSVANLFASEYIALARTHQYAPQALLEPPSPALPVSVGFRAPHGDIAR